MKVSNGLRKKAYDCKSEEELIALAKENGIELSQEEAAAFINRAKEGELSDSELESVSGGAKGCKRNAYEVEWYHHPNVVEFIFEYDAIVQAFVSGKVGNETATVKIIGMDTEMDENSFRYKDVYLAQKVSGAWSERWIDRSRVQKQ